jgi:hypothetical protein
MPDNSFMHLTGEEFDSMQGFADGRTSSESTTSGKNIIAYKGKGGKMSFHTDGASKDMWGNSKIIDDASEHGHVDEEHSKRKALIDNAVQTVQNDPNPAKAGQKKIFSSQGTRGIGVYSGTVEFKPRENQFNILGDSDRGRRASSALRRMGERVSRSIQDKDMSRAINDAKKFSSTYKRKPRINMNNFGVYTRFNKFNKDQLKEIGQHIDFFRG